MTQPMAGLCTYVAPTSVTLSSDAHVVCHAVTSVRVPAAAWSASDLFLEKSVRDLRPENWARMGGNPERMSWVHMMCQNSKADMHTGGLWERQTHVGDRAAHGVQSKLRNRVQASGDSLERGQDCLRRLCKVGNDLERVQWPFGESDDPDGRL